MKDYIAWLNGASVARGTLSSVRARALEIFNTPRWQERDLNGTILRVTRGARQLFVSSEVLSKPVKE